MSLLSDTGPVTFLVLTVIIGGGAAILAGRGLARAWKPYWRVFVYMALLAGAVRFFHYALFEGALTSLYYYLVTYLILAAFGSLGYRWMRTTQMVTQYRWLYERTSPLTWRHRHAKPVSH
jgi:hypothetical protein